MWASPAELEELTLRRISYANLNALPAFVATARRLRRLAVSGLQLWSSASTSDTEALARLTTLEVAAGAAAALLSVAWSSPHHMCCELSPTAVCLRVETWRPPFPAFPLVCPLQWLELRRSYMPNLPSELTGLARLTGLSLVGSTVLSAELGVGQAWG